jgi:hypothetical protein
MTAWIYDQGRELELFATREVAGAWIEENDPEGGAFKYDALGMEEAAN